MTKQDILDELTTKIEASLEVKSMTDELTGSEQTTLTDELAGVLEAVNPNHNYPPVPKS